MRTFTRLTRALGLVAAASLLGLMAACGGDDNGSEGQPETTGAVSVRDTNNGQVLVDSEGRTLYTNNQDAVTSIACVAGCAQFWPPVPATVPETSDSRIAAKLSMVTRPDGTTQLAYDGKPLYTFAEDRTPGQVKGDGFTDDFEGKTFVWTVARPQAANSPADSAPIPNGNGY